MLNRRSNRAALMVWDGNLARLADEAGRTADADRYRKAVEEHEHWFRVYDERITAIVANYQNQHA